MIMHSTQTKTCTHTNTPVERHAQVFFGFTELKFEFVKKNELSLNFM